MVATRWRKGWETECRSADAGSLSFGTEQRAGSARRAGFTIIEVLIYTGVALLLGGSLVSVALVSTRSMFEGDTVNRLAERNRVALFRVAREVRTAMGTSVAVSSDGRTLNFTLAGGVDAGGLVPGDNVRFVLRPAVGESVNGVDDNGDGLVDEGLLTRVNLSTKEATTICATLDVGRSSFALNAGTIVATFTNSGRMPEAGSVFTVSRTVRVEPRN